MRFGSRQVGSLVGAALAVSCSRTPHTTTSTGAGGNGGNGGTSAPITSTTSTTSTAATSASGAVTTTTTSSAGGPCSPAGPTWADEQSVSVANDNAPGRTGQWWCTNHFGGNLGGAWECIEGTGSNCTSDAPANGTVRCGRLAPDGSTPYCGAGTVIAPYGYGRVERVLVDNNQSAPGRTGEWWCMNHFGNNLGGSWTCRSVSGGNDCSATVPNGEVVSCSIGTAPVDESSFAPPPCNSPSLDANSSTFCSLTEYMSTRTLATVYLYNDWLRAGFNRSFGGTLFELYGADKRNRIEEHGGSAAQLSVWGYDIAASGAGYFTTDTCNPTPFSDAATCKAANSNQDCRVFARSGAQISNCTTESMCGTWSAAAPWNPIQAQAAGCGWNGPTNDVDQVTASGGDITFLKHDPYQFTKTTALTGLTWSATGRVAYDRPYLHVTYQMGYASSRDIGEHNQEIPALFTDDRIGHWYYYYGGSAPYADAQGAVTRLRSDFGTELVLPGRMSPEPQPPPMVTHPATEEWMTVCNEDESQCLTEASFSPEVKVFVQGGQYVTPLGRFGLGSSSSHTWDVYLFPYRFDDVVAGKTVRQWVYDIKNGI